MTVSVCCSVRRVDDVLLFQPIDQTASLTANHIAVAQTVQQVDTDSQS